MKQDFFPILTPRLDIRAVRLSDDISILKAASCPQINLMHNNEFNDITKVQGYIHVLLREYSNDV